MYAKVINGKVVKIVQGQRPEGFIDADLRFNLPTQYPELFYTPESVKPNTYIQNNVPVVEYNYQIKPLSIIKIEVNKIIKSVRQIKQLGSFMFGKVEVPLKDREDSLIIASLPEVSINYKISDGVFVSLTGIEVGLLKEAHRAHIQNAYDWEMLESGKVQNVTEYQEMVEYLDTLYADEDYQKIG